MERQFSEKSGNATKGDSIRNWSGGKAEIYLFNGLSH
jgi:hypothetical protein